MNTIQAEAPQMLERAFVEDWSSRWLAAWNAHDAEAIASLCTDDVVVDEPALPHVLTGRAGMSKFAEATFGTFPDVRIEELEPPYNSAERAQVLAPYRLVGTMRGAWPFHEIAPTGARVDFRGVDEWEFRDERLCRYLTYYDSLDVARQMGVLPPAGCRADRFFSRVQHLQARFQRRAHARAADRLGP
jgi:steroid delta-isomerase-like uncharacterized protein